ncbi:MAG TPA: PrsW family intramembrane metalloprotease [Amycolatopsis sp.]|nr:PrsW family intramembrane metalloprotease [Amycolatopsis sp.]
MLLPVLGLIVVAVCGLGLLALATVRVGPLAVVIGAAAALIPVAIVVATFLWVDRWEPEPARLLLLAFAWGACIATITALLINNTAETVGDLLLGKGNGSRVSALVSAPLVEEAAKGSFVLAIMLRRSEEFDGIVDGIVYAGVTAAGFAFTENIYYFGRAFADYGFGDGASSGVIAAFVLRGILSPFTHPLFASITGIGLGIAARTPRGPSKVLIPLGCYLAAVCLHALWNGAATLGGAKAFLNVYFLIMVPIFIAVVLLVMLQRRREQRTIEAALPGMVEAGWIAASEVGLLSSLAERRDWRRQARKQSGRHAARAVASYQASVTELAFLKRHKAGPATLQREAELLSTLRSSRAEAVRLAGESSHAG